MLSVYGAEAAFRRHATPGGSFFVDRSREYSLTRSWVLALDATFRRNSNTRATGYEILGLSSAQNRPTVQLDSGSSGAVGFAPAIEYSWKPNLGVLLGARVMPPSHNTHATITPVVAINFVH